MFRFSIRDLLMVTLLVAIAMGWGVDHYRASTQERQLRQAGEKTAESLREAERKTAENLQETRDLATGWERNARELAIILNGKHGYRVTQEAHRDGVNLGIIFPPST